MAAPFEFLSLEMRLCICSHLRATHLFSEGEENLMGLIKISIKVSSRALAKLVHLQIKPNHSPFASHLYILAPVKSLVAYLGGNMMTGNNQEERWVETDAY